MCRRNFRVKEVNSLQEKQLIKWLKISCLLVSILILLIIVQMMEKFSSEISNKNTNPSINNSVVYQNYPETNYDAIDKISRSIVYFGNTKNGTGIIMLDDVNYYYVITAYHVIDEEKSPLKLKLYDGTEVEAIIIDKGTESDLSILGISKKEINNKVNVSVSNIRTEVEIKKGMPVLAVGNACGYGETISKGIVSGFKTTVINETTYKLIQTDAALNEGNSGGGLFDTNGNLIGMTIIKSNNELAEGMGFAVNLQTARSYIINIIAEFEEMNQS